MHMYQNVAVLCFYPVVFFLSDGMLIVARRAGDTQGMLFVFQNCRSAQRLS